MRLNTGGTQTQFASCDNLHIYVYYHVTNRGSKCTINIFRMFTLSKKEMRTPRRVQIV